MKRFTRSILGVTLLEIMLVLAIAAMILVMSVRYYNAANTSQQANAFTQTIAAIIGAAGAVIQQQGSASAATDSAILSYLGPTALQLPWGGSIALSGAADALTMTLTPPPTGGVCTLITSQVKNLGGVTGGTTCATFTYSPGAGATAAQ